MTRYNGWSNYETWNFKLWLDNDESVHNYIINGFLSKKLRLLDMTLRFMRCLIF